MRQFRRNSLRDKIIAAFSQLLILIFSCLFCLWMISGAKAVEGNSLTEINSLSPSEDTRVIEINFSGTLSADKVQANFERNFLQFSVEDVTAFPARTKETGNKVLDKVYVYQYQPNLARARVYIVGDLSRAKKAINWKVEKNKIIISFNQSSFEATKTNEKPRIETTKQELTKDQVQVSASSNEKTALSKDEEVLLQSMADRMNKKEGPESKATAAPTIGATTSAETNDLFSGMKNDSRPKDANKEQNNGFGFGKLFFNLLLVLSLIGATAYGFRKFVLKKGLSLSGHGTGKLIHVLTSYNIAPGKQLMVVKVASDYLVLAVAGNNISLVSTLDADAELDKLSEPKKPENKFTKILQSQIERFDENDEIKTETAEGALGVRESIKNRIRGFKQLT